MVSPAPLPPANPAASFHLQTLYERLCYYLDQLGHNIVMCWHTAPPTFLPLMNPRSFHLQTLYERSCDYLELDRRVEVLNARFTVLQGMLDMMRDHITTSHR